LANRSFDACKSVHFACENGLIDDSTCLTNQNDVCRAMIEYRAAMPPGRLPSSTYPMIAELPIFEHIVDFDPIR